MATSSAAASGLAWEDTSAYLNALDTLLTTTPDTDALAAWRSAKQELQATFGAAGAHAKRVLQELQASYARAEAASAEAALPIEELRLRLEQVEARKAAVLERVQRMAVARDASAAAMQRLLQDTLALREEQRRLEGMKQGASPQLQHQLALYFNLTGIKWDYTAEQALEGFISPTNGQPPRVLRINPRGLSSVQIADMLWAEVGEAYRLP